eukprot:gene2589-5062_t
MYILVVNIVLGMVLPSVLSQQQIPQILLNHGTPGHSDDIAHLLDTDPSILNATDEYGMTALMWASEYGCEKCVGLLLSRGADVKIQDEDGWTALKWASLSGKLPCVSLLLQHGADVNVQDKWGDSSLILASMMGHSGVVKLLLEHNADVNMRSHKGDTALMWASRYGKTETLKLLLQHGADANIKDQDGRTALDVARKRVIQALIRNASHDIQTSTSPAQICSLPSPVQRIALLTNIESSLPRAIRPTNTAHRFREETRIKS